MPPPLALDGHTVLDLTELLPGPFATQMLVDMGAEVIKIERPGSGDRYRSMRPGSFPVINRGKKSVVLDLKMPAGKEIFLRLAARADVLVEGYRPGVMQQLGLGYDAVKRANPRIIFASITGFGQTGALRDFPGHDLNYNAVAGVLAMCGRSPHPEHALGVPLADLTGGLYAVSSVLAALMLRQHTGMGQFLDVALTDAVLTLVGPRVGYSKQELLYRAGNNVYETKDRRYIAVAALEDDFWARLAKVLSVPALSNPKYARARERWRASAELDPIIQEKMRERTHDEWLQILAENDVPATSVCDHDDIFEQPQLRARGMFVEQGGMRYVNYPVPMEGVDARRHFTFCSLGGHTDEVLAAAGYTANEIASFRSSGVFRCSSPENKDAKKSHV